jgi:hypothetical protein
VSTKNVGTSVQTDERKLGIRRVRGNLSVHPEQPAMSGPGT